MEKSGLIRYVYENKGTYHLKAGMYLKIKVVSVRTMRNSDYNDLSSGSLGYRQLFRQQTLD